MAKLDLISLAPDVVLIFVLGFLIRSLFGKMSSIEEKTHQNNINTVLVTTKLEAVEKDISYIKAKMQEFDDE